MRMIAMAEGRSVTIAASLTTWWKSIRPYGLSIAVLTVSPAPLLSQRFKVGSWQSGPTITSAHEAQVLTQVEQFLTSHPGDHVRLLSIDPGVKQRQLEKVIQKPE
ncbi:MAG: ribulose bisphosphate carboxylase small subunit [Cyanobacteria bacterium P01_C01_bin.118]